MPPNCRKLLILYHGVAKMAFIDGDSYSKSSYACVVDLLDWNMYASCGLVEEKKIKRKKERKKERNSERERKSKTERKKERERERGTGGRAAGMNE